MNREASHFALSYLPLLIRLRSREATRLPNYLGSTLHGVVGWALTSHENAYRYIFENYKCTGGEKDIANPYIIDPPAFRSIYSPGDELSFQFTLIGNAVEYARDVIDALAQTKKFGIGAERKLFELEEILHGQQLKTIWPYDSSSTGSTDSVLLADNFHQMCEYCSIHLLTPLRIRRGGALVTDIDFTTIIRSITRRMSELTRRYGGEINTDEIESLIELSRSICRTSSGLYLTKMNRYSSRRETKVDLSGLLGAMTFQGDIEPFTSWLHAAKIFHIGRNVTFGCGRIDTVMI